MASPLTIDGAVNAPSVALFAATAAAAAAAAAAVAEAESEIGGVGMSVMAAK